MTENLNIDANFKSTLPPRKRARTKEEKEQRRVERILRNRRAAHASREKKRKHVEFLESYVLKLESNLEKLQSNFEVACKNVTLSKLSSIKFEELDDVSDLKTNIHQNLNSSTSLEETDLVSDNKRHKIDTSSNTTSSVSESPEPCVKQEDEDNACLSGDSNELLSVSNEGVFFNYLSPISINSPVNSPIDLTLKKSDENITHLSLSDTEIHQTEATKEYDTLGQNSEEILFTRGYDHSLSVGC